MERFYPKWRLVVAVGLCLLLFSCGPAGLFPVPDREDAADNLFRQAETLYRTHCYAEAGAAYNRYLQLYPQGPDYGRVWLRTAELLGIKGDWMQARSRYEQIAAKVPSPAQKLRARVGMGQANFKLGNYPAATQILEGLPISTLPPDLRFKNHALLSEIALKLRDYPRAGAYLNQASQDLTEGDQEWFRDLKARLVDEADPADLKKMVELCPQAGWTAAILLKLAQRELQGGRPEQGRAFAQQLVERFPDSPEAVQARRLVPAEAAPEAPAVAGEVGCLVPLSGSYANVGQQVRQGMELAAEDSRLQLVIKDSQGDPVTAARLVEELARDVQIKILVGPVASVSAVAAAQAAQTRELPILTLTQRKDITGFGNLVYRDFLTASQQVKALVDYVVGRLGLKRFAVLYPDGTYGQTFAQLFQEEVNRAGGLIVTQVAFPDESHDFSAALATLTQAARPGPEAPAAFEAIFIPDESPTVAALVEQLAAAQFTGVRLLGTNLWNSPEVAALDAMNGALFPEAFFLNDPAPEVRAFVEAYRRRYHQEPTYMAAQGYSTIKLLATVLGEGAGLNRIEVAQRLAAARQVPGFSLFRGFTADREADLKIKIMTIKDHLLQVTE